MRPRAAIMPKRLAPSWPSELPSIDRAEAVLLSASVLHLQEVVLPWTSAAYHGLIDLRLEYNKGLSEARISITNLANTFTASPALETLKISGLAITLSDDWDSSTRVPLAYLRVLCLSNMFNESWELVLSLISLSDCLNTLSVGFKTYNQSELASPICHFLRESPVETLAFTEGSGSGASPFWVLEASTAAPLLKNLILVQAIFFEDEECDTLAALLVDMSSSSRRLPNLYMVSSLLDFSDLQLIVPRYGVQALHFERCNTVFSMSDIPGDPKTPEELGDRLRDSCLGLNCTVSDIDTTADWPCRTMFD
ncbi:hypothetical protein FRC09_013409 [Ceratobasidium sp. 395]|nr:hypothetical protein FRC09_013409 [Ceratobasidium sp. 395]